ncbi:hypothetical protein ACIBKY_38545 [Nonomuraea sp. NPDC050394]|uniref:hypothetical protein n=1 Tax=Nonomuraea sp. NPDC050394 TaxID=3364363 RepID=UPI003794B415
MQVMYAPGLEGRRGLSSAQDEVERMGLHMITAVRTFAAAALVTIAFAVSVPAANASSSGDWRCTDGNSIFISDSYGYVVHAVGCVGQGSGDGTITITSGYYAGSFYCYNTMVYSGGGVSGFHCFPY